MCLPGNDHRRFIALSPTSSSLAVARCASTGSFWQRIVYGIPVQVVAAVTSLAGGAMVIAPLLGVERW